MYKNMYKKIAAVLILAVAVGIVIQSASRPENPTQTSEREWKVADTSEREWKVADSEAYARDVVLSWADNQYHCLHKLWTRESNWKPDAYNKIKVMGKNAGGIPQILGLDPKTPAPLQIDRGMKYIIYRYGTPCMAWKFHRQKGWY
jgi:hypothetical protein